MKRLERSRKDRVFQGVCGGVAEYLGVDSNLIRVLWILSIVCGGAGVIPYVVAIFLLPEGEAPAEARSDGSTRILGLVLIALAAFFFLRAFQVNAFIGWVFAFWTLGILLPLALLVAGVLLVWPRTRDAVGFARSRKPQRSVSDRVIAGVAGGIARELGTDANLLRLVFVAAAVVTSGFVALIYLLLVVILPEEELDAPGPSSGSRPEAGSWPSSAPEAPASPAGPGTSSPAAPSSSSDAPSPGGPSPAPPPGSRSEPGPTGTGEPDQGEEEDRR